VCVIAPESPAVDPSEASGRWYLEVSGRRIGPYAWSVVLELAQVGGLAAADRLWNPSLPAWMRVDEFPVLAALIPVASQRAAAESTAVDVTAPPPSPSPEAESVPNRRLASPSFRLGAGIAWSLVVGAFWWQSYHDWPGVVDGVLIARLRTIGALFLVAAGFVVLPALWSATRATDDRSIGFVGGALRVLAAACAFILVVTTLSVLINARVLLQIAFGSDPMGRGEILLLPSGTELEVRGTFNAGIASQLTRTLRDHPEVHFVHLNSRGGWVGEGTRMADLIHSRKLGTYTATGCYSACVLAFVAGSPRLLNPDARLGLHSATADGMDPFLIERINDQYKETLRRLGVSEEFVRQATSAPSTQLWVPSPSELMDNHMVDQVSDAGMSVSGEALTELARRSANLERGSSALQRLKRADPARFALLDRKVRLALRRGASQLELQQYVTRLAAGAEVQP
jgi:hypothetical protein